MEQESPTRDIRVRSLTLFYKIILEETDSSYTLHCSIPKLGLNTQDEQFSSEELAEVYARHRLAPYYKRLYGLDQINVIKI